MRSTGREHRGAGTSVSHRLLVKDNHGERELLLLDTILVGRDPLCEISEADPQMSRRHARFSVSDRGVVVNDLHSRNGVLVNGRRVLEAVLHPGDVVQVAGVAITFLRASEPAALSLPDVAPPAKPVPPSGAAPSAQALLPFGLQHRPPPDEERTTVLSPDEVAAAVASAVPPPRREDTAGGPPATLGADSPDAHARAGSPLPVEDVVRAAPPSPLPGDGRPALATIGRMPITGVGGPAWAASLTWQVATLSLISFFVGAVSVLPWKVGIAAGGGWDAAVALLAPLAALIGALALGLLVAGRLRRGVTEAINEILARAGRS